jgi:predicted DsbA family dithiol-disulfide isomerase
VRVEIWSDVICPWCYIGKARFEKALAGFDHRDDVEVEYRSFELDPTRGKQDVEPVEQMLTKRYGPQASEMEQRVARMARAEGLGYRVDREVGSTFDAHRLLHFTRAQGVQTELVTAIFEANFRDARPIFTDETLLEIAVKAGLDEEEARRVLDDPAAYADAVRQEEREAAALGATGVPFFVIDRRYGVAGAQPTEAFEQALHQAWATRDSDSE